MIVETPGTCGGKPRIDGTRITVSLIMEYVDASYTHDQITELYPHITKENIDECIEYTQREKK